MHTLSYTKTREVVCKSKQDQEKGATSGNCRNSGGIKARNCGKVCGNSRKFPQIGSTFFLWNVTIVVKVRIKYLHRCVLCVNSSSFHSNTSYRHLEQSRKKWEKT